MHQLAILVAALVLTPPPQAALPLLAPPLSAAAAASQTRPQIEQLHRRTRERMLASLAPAHRAFLAQLAGDLVVAQTPDIPAAVRLLDATLTSRETKAIVRIQNDELGAAQRIVRAALGEPQPGPGTRAAANDLRRIRETDAGRSLLRSALLIGSYERR